LIDLLDALAGEVIYSKRHLLESPFIVSSGDTLESIANRFHISPEALARINLMGDSKVVLAGTQLKVLNGPMRADVNLTRGELTLFLHDLYAGRFPISVGKEPAPIEGSFQIVDRRRDRTYYGANSQVFPATDGRNPYGGFWMSLGKDMCIHGSPATTMPELASAGCISLAPLDAREVYTLLSLGSQVTIHR
jgi:LysM repeat protein